MCKLYVCQTRIGPFFIAYLKGQYSVIFENESLARYSTPEQAAQHISGRDHFLVGGGIDTKWLGIPANLHFWENCLQQAVGF